MTARQCGGALTDRWRSLADTGWACRESGSRHIPATASSATADALCRTASRLIHWCQMVSLGITARMSIDDGSMCHSIYYDFILAAQSETRLTLNPRIHPRLDRCWGLVASRLSNERIMLLFVIVVNQLTRLSGLVRLRCKELAFAGQVPVCPNFAND